MRKKECMTEQGPETEQKIQLWLQKKKTEQPQEETRLECLHNVDFGGHVLSGLTCLMLLKAKEKFVCCG